MGDTRTILIITGVSGSGKTTIATTLAEQLGWPFKEGDELHLPSNITKMHSGHPLDDRDRWPWLEKVADWIDGRRQAGTAGVITCSALKRSYRDFLASGRPEVRVVYLHGEKATITARLAERKGHFMPRSLLDSQFAVLEEPDPDEESIRLETDQLVGDIVAEIVRELNPPTESRSPVIPQIKPDLKQASATVGPRPAGATQAVRARAPRRSKAKRVRRSLHTPLGKGARRPTTRGRSAHLSERAISDRRPNPKWECGKDFVRTALALDLGPICSIGGFS